MSLMAAEIDEPDHCRQSKIDFFAREFRDATTCPAASRATGLWYGGCHFALAKKPDRFGEADASG
jgi:hypothetical protein